MSASSNTADSISKHMQGASKEEVDEAIMISLDVFLLLTIVIIFSHNLLSADHSQATFCSSQSCHCAAVKLLLTSFASAPCRECQSVSRYDLTIEREVNSLTSKKTVGET